MADEKTEIVTDTTGPGAGPATAQPEVAAQVPKQEQPAPAVPAPEKAGAPRSAGQGRRRSQGAKGRQRVGL